jgi:uncharacterized protein (TIGR02186 family)
MEPAWIVVGIVAAGLLFLRMIKFAVRVILIVLLLGAFFVWKVQAQELSVEVASDHIDITVGFTGSRIEVFGDKRDKDTDVAVFVIGPEKTITVWEKAPVLGAWVNRHFAAFRRQPGYYNYATSFDEAKREQNKALMLENRIGVDALFEKADIRLSNKDAREKFIQALVAQKQHSGVYPVESADMKFMNDHFFRVGFDIPPAAPTGEYKIHSFLIKNGQVVEGDIDLLKVEQVGLNAFVLVSAKNYSLLYSVFCIILAVFSGWLVSALRVRP